MTERQPDATRRKIVEVAATHIHRNGFQASSVGEILQEVGVSKGALYHHFPTKNDLGHAVIDRFAEMHRERWAAVLAAPDPLTSISGFLEETIDCLDDDEIACGCPINNLAQEMSPVDEGFRVRIHAVFERWREEVSDAFERAQSAGTIREDVEPRLAATFLVAALEGSISLGKAAQSKDLMRDCAASIAAFLETLRPHATAAP